MSRHRDLLLTLLQITLVTSFPHGGRHHNFSGDTSLDMELDVLPSAPPLPLSIPSPFPTSVAFSTPNFSVQGFTSSGVSSIPEVSSLASSVPALPSISSLVPSLPSSSAFSVQSTVSTDPAPVVSSSTLAVDTSTFPPVVSSSSIVESHGTSVTGPPPIATDTLTFTSTTSCETDSNGVPVQPTSPVSSEVYPYPTSYPVTYTTSYPTTYTTSYPISPSTITEESTSSITVVSTATRTKPVKSSSLPLPLTSSSETFPTPSPAVASPPPPPVFSSTSIAVPKPPHSHKAPASNPAVSQHFASTSTATPRSQTPHKGGSLFSSTETIVTFITSTQAITFTSTTTAHISSLPALSPSHHGKGRKTRKHKTTSQATNPATPFTSRPEVTLETTLTVSEIQTLTVTTTATPTSGSLQTSLNTHGQNTEQPFKTTVIATPSSHVKPVTSGTNRIQTTVIATPTAPMSGNIFAPIATGAPPANIPTNPNHPVPRLGITNSGPIETNKFYANFFLGTRTAPTFTHPYSVAWVQGQGVSGSWGISVQQVTRAQTVYGPDTPPSYFINPIGLQQVILSARELAGSTDLTMDHLQGFSCNVNLSPYPGAAPVVTFPLVQGMGFVTAVYQSGTPMIQSSIFFQSLMYGGSAAGGAARYTATLLDETVWFIYVTANSGSALPTLTLVNSGEILGNMAFSGTVQVAKIPAGSSLADVQRIYDASAGVYPVNGNIKGSVSKAQGSYSLSWAKQGKVGKTLLMFALPHHVQSFSSGTSAALRHSLKLDTTTKGTATAVHADSWVLEHDDLPFDMEFAPWSPQHGSNNKLSETAKQLIATVAASELAENFTQQTDLDSMYYSGKGLAKFAFTVYATNNLAKDVGTASAGLVELKQSFALFVNNQQIFPLYYDSAWGGAVSSCSYTTGQDACDFGNTYYNDHHFHYGYFVYTAAVIGFLDPSWLKEGTNKAWVNMLVRDYANPVSDDGYFPFQRMFDWYHGHSWAHGLYETFDGKDQESSSEDTFSLYAIKMWGKVIGDANMEARGNLLLAVQARSLQHYYLLADDNTVEPSVYIPNKAAGIIFENKIDHTTYFGTNIEYIEGIHMLPLAPQSTLSRTKAFVSQEWATYFSDGRVDAIDSGWKGILYANYAIVDPVTAWNFFAQPGFSPTWLDGGASRTWYLAWCAGLGGAPA